MRAAQFHFHAEKARAGSLACPYAPLHGKAALSQFRWLNSRQILLQCHVAAVAGKSFAFGSMCVLARLTAMQISPTPVAIRSIFPAWWVMSPAANTPGRFVSICSLTTIFLLPCSSRPQSRSGPMSALKPRFNRTASTSRWCSSLVLLLPTRRGSRCHCLLRASIHATI